MSKEFTLPAIFERTVKVEASCATAHTRIDNLADLVSQNASDTAKLIEAWNKAKGAIAMFLFLGCALGSGITLAVQYFVK